MRRISSFDVDHTRLECGMYISRIDGDVITYDLRVKKPNTGNLMSNVQMHTAEHMIATFVRNSEIGDDVIYFGPMGCQTGFYLLVRDSITPDKVLEVVKNILEKTCEYDGEVFGKSEKECGNYRSLDLDEAKAVCREYADILKSVTRVKTYAEV